MKHLQSFQEQAFFTVKYQPQELNLADLQAGEWSLTDHLQPKVSQIIASLTDLQSRLNTTGVKISKEEVEKVEQIYALLAKADCGTCDFIPTNTVTNLPGFTF